MTTIDLYLDPVCPFAWVTSRWLLDAAQKTQRPVTLRQMSLAVLNAGQDADEAHQRMFDRSRRLGRLFAEVNDRYGPEGFARLYEPIGTRLHDQKDEITPKVVTEVLSDLGFEESLSDCLDEAEYDEAVRRAHAASQDALGDEAGSPIIAIDGRAFFGPVLTPVYPSPTIASCSWTRWSAPPVFPSSPCYNARTGRQHQAGFFPLKSLLLPQTPA